MDRLDSTYRMLFLCVRHAHRLQSGHQALVWNVALSTSGTARDSAIEHVLSGHNRSVTDINWSSAHRSTYLLLACRRALRSLRPGRPGDLRTR
jgi:uncharacterized protein (DUF2252 family)